MLSVFLFIALAAVPEQACAMEEMLDGYFAPFSYPSVQSAFAMCCMGFSFASRSFFFRFSRTSLLETECSLKSLGSAGMMNTCQSLAVSYVAQCNRTF